MVDVLILGYGPAGVSAALYALRSKLSVQMIGKDVGALSKAHLIENYYGLEKPISGTELAEIGKSQVKALGALLNDGEVTDLFYDGNSFVATTSAGDEFRGKTCILATGSARKKQPMKGLSELEGHGVSYCAVCDAFFYREKNVAIMGSGEYALHEVQQLLPVVGSVTLLTNGEPLKVQFPPNVKIEERVLKSVLGESSFEGVAFADGSEKSFDGLFVALGSASATDLAKKAGAVFENGNLVLDANFQTSIPGLFAAGDCTGGTLQIAVAVGEGAIAGLSAVKYLRESK